MSNTSTFDSVYQVKLAQIAALQGDTTKNYDSVYQTELEILKKLKEGAGGAQIDDQNISTGTVWSSSKTDTEILASANDYITFQQYETFTQEKADLLYELQDKYDKNITDHIFVKSPITGHWKRISSFNGGQVTFIDDYLLWIYVYTMLVNIPIGSQITIASTIKFSSDGALINDSNTSTGQVWSSSKVNTQLNTKQDTLVSGTNIKTINNNSLLGSGNIDIQGGGAGVVELTQAQYDALAVKDPSIIYHITDASVYVMEDYFSKAAADASFGALDTKYNPYNTTTAYATAGYSGYFPSWNSNGQITGKGSYVNSRSFTINGTTNTILGSSNISLPNVYAATTAGTAGQILQSKGSGAPQWVNFKSDATAYISEADCSAGTYSDNISTFYADCITALKIGPLQLLNAVDHQVPTIGEDLLSFSAGDKCGVENNSAAHVYYDDGTLQHTLTLNSDGTVEDPDNTGAVTSDASTSISGYNIFNVVLPISVSDGTVYSIEYETHRSYSYYYPSSTRLYEGNVELWFFTTEDGATWNNLHVLITNSTVTADTTSGTFGA